MRKTAMVQLRDKLLEEVEDKRKLAETDKYVLGYSHALQNIANHIDAEMMAIEEEVLNEVERRQQLIISEPNGIVRETMITNLLIDI